MINLNYTFSDKYTESTFKIRSAITDPDTGIVTDPTTVKISIEDPDGVLDVDDTDMSKNGIGDYYYDYTIPANVGAYRGHTVCTSATGLITITTFGFWAEASI